MSNRVVSLLKLDAIKNQLEQTQTFVINSGGQENKADARLLALLQQLFAKKDSVLLNATGIKELKLENNCLLFSGVIQDFYAHRQPLQAKFCLYDEPLTASQVRHLIFWVSIPGKSSAMGFINYNSLDFDEDNLSSNSTINPKFSNSIESIKFDKNSLLFSSKSIHQLDTRKPVDLLLKEKLLPQEWHEQPITAGINFLADTGLTPPWGRYLQAINDNNLIAFLDQLTEDDEQAEAGPFMAYKHPNICVICPGADLSAFSDVTELSAYFKLVLNPIENNTLDLKLIKLKLEYTEFNLLKPLNSRDDEMDLHMVGTLTLDLPSKISLGVRVGLYPYAQQLIIDFYHFPSLIQILNLITQNPEDRQSNPVFSNKLFTQLLNIELSHLQFVLDCAENTISAIALTVAAKEPIALIEDKQKVLIGFKPELKMEVSNPLEPKSREITGTFSGTWQLGNTRFNIALYYPDFSFYAAMAENQVLDVGEVIQTLLAGVEFPHSGHATVPMIKLTKMEVNGNFQSKSFSAEFEAEDEWTFRLVNQEFRCSVNRLFFEYNPQEISASIEGELTLFGVTGMVSAYYRGGEGWLFTAATPLDTPISLFGPLNHMLEGIALPDAFPSDIQLENLMFSAEPVSGEYAFEGQTTAGPWPLLNQMVFSVDRFEVRKRSGEAVSGLLRVSLEICGIFVRFKAEKSASVAGGWIFEGSSGYGHDLEIGKLIQRLGEDFGAIHFPEYLDRFSITCISLSFNSSSQDFFFSCEGALRLPDYKEPAQGRISIDIKHQGKGSYTKKLSGALFIAGMKFNLNFEASHQLNEVSASSPVTDTKLFTGAFHDEYGHVISIDDALRAVSRDAPQTGLEITLKDALFAYHWEKSAQEVQSKFLMGVNVEGGLNLSSLKLPDLPLISQTFPPEQSLRFMLQVLYANRRFEETETSAINQLNGQGFSFPKQSAEGLQITALLKNGLDIKSFDFPIAIDKEHKSFVDATPVSVSREREGAVATAKSGATKWVKIQKSIGPVHIERVGVGYDAGKIAFLLDSAFSAAGLSVSLDGLGAEFLLTDLSSQHFDPSFHLNGLGIDYKNGSLEIGGSFLEHELTRNGEKYKCFSGLAVIRTSKLAMSAIGSYTQLKDRDVSLFVYAAASYPLGGPPFFFVNGFAAGFGYNRSLLLPAIEEVASFPLVKQAVQDGGPKKLPSGKEQQQNALLDRLEQLETYLPPSAGEVFVAAGVKFNSFKQVDSFALLAVKFGRQFEIDLLGHSSLIAPPPETSKGAAPLAQAQLLLKASFVPDEGFLGVRAQLTPNSYVFSKDCHISGGFAFYTWFGPHPNAGDFALTLGGYHPKFLAPAHYPKVPRLAINWQVNPELHVNADAYFALTGSALMAGGHLQVVWEHEKLKAWFNAGADFIVCWQPYHYDADLYIDIGVSYTFNIFGNHSTITADLGADLHLWGPEFAGEATIHWSIISFSVSFGPHTSKELKPVTWGEFKTAFLPKPEQICSITVQQGLVRQMHDEEQGDSIWIVNAKDMRLSIQSVAPFHGTGPLSPDLQLDDRISLQAAGMIAIAPMGIETGVSSFLTITLLRESKPLDQPRAFLLSPVLKDMPAGLWGKPQLTADGKHLKKPDLNGPLLVENLIAGFEIRPNKTVEEANSCEISGKQLELPMEQVPKSFVWSKFKVDGPQGKAAFARAAQTVIGKHDQQIKLFSAMGLVNPVIDFGEPVDQGILVD